MELPWKAASDDFNGFLDHGMSFTGELNFSGTLRIDGNVHGTIRTSGVLIIGEPAVVHADIHAGEVRIHGAVVGNVEGKRRVDILPTGHLSGDVRTSRLVIEEGGVFEGLSQLPSDAPSDNALEDLPESAPAHKETDDR